MNLVNALALVLGVIGGALTYLSLSTGLFMIWATFVFTATGVALGGTAEAFKNLVACALMGMALAVIASLLILYVNLGLPGPLWPAVVVGATTACLALVAHIPLFPAIPATVIGYASTFAYVLSANLLTPEGILGGGTKNPVFLITTSLIVAYGFGRISLALVGKLTQPPVLSASPQ